jgi:hypothetical protein
MCLHLSQNFLGKELANVLGRNGMEGIIHGDAYALLALTHAEGAAQLYLIADLVLGNEILQLLYDLTRTLDMAGASDTNSNFKHNLLPHNQFIFIGVRREMLCAMLPPDFIGFQFTGNRLRRPSLQGTLAPFRCP